MCVTVELQEDTFLVYISGKQGEIRGISVNASTGAADVMVPVQSSLRPVALATHAATRFVYFSDADRRKVVRRKLESSDSQIEDVLVGGMCDVSTACVVDCVGGCAKTDAFKERRLLFTTSLVTNVIRSMVMCTCV